MAIDQGVLDSVTNANFKTLAEQVSSNAASHQNRLQLIAESSLGQNLNRMNALDPEEAASISMVNGKIGDLGAQIAAVQQLIKGAQTTLPETG